MVLGAGDSAGTKINMTKEQEQLLAKKNEEYLLGYFRKILENEEDFWCVLDFKSIEDAKNFRDAQKHHFDEPLIIVRRVSTLELVE